MRKIPFFKVWVTDFIAHTADLTDSDVGKIMRHLSRRAMGFPEKKLPDRLKNVIKFLEESQNIDAEKYEAIILKNQHAANARWNANATPDAVPTLNSEFLTLNKSINKEELLPKPDAENFILPDWIDKEAWRGFEEMRRKIKKPMTDRARGMIIKKLESWRDKHDVNKILDESTLKDYQDVWEPNQSIKTAQPKSAAPNIRDLIARGEMI